MEQIPEEISFDYNNYEPSHSASSLVTNISSLLGNTSSFLTHAREFADITDASETPKNIKLKHSNGINNSFKDELPQRDNNDTWSSSIFDVSLNSNINIKSGREMRREMSTSSNFSQMRNAQDESNFQNMSVDQLNKKFDEDRGEQLYLANPIANSFSRSINTSRGNSRGELSRADLTIGKYFIAKSLNPWDNSVNDFSMNFGGDSDNDGKKNESLRDVTISSINTNVSTTSRDSVFKSCSRYLGRPILNEKNYEAPSNNNNTNKHDKSFSSQTSSTRNSVGTNTTVVMVESDRDRDLTPPPRNSSRCSNESKASTASTSSHVSLQTNCSSGAHTMPIHPYQNYQMPYNNNGMMMMPNPYTMPMQMQMQPGMMMPYYHQPGYPPLVIQINCPHHNHNQGEQSNSCMHTTSTSTCSQSQFNNNVNSQINNGHLIPQQQHQQHQQIQCNNSNNNINSQQIKVDNSTLSVKTEPATTDPSTVVEKIIIPRSRITSPPVRENANIIKKDNNYIKKKSSKISFSAPAHSTPNVSYSKSLRGSERFAPHNSSGTKSSSITLNSIAFELKDFFTNAKEKSSIYYFLCVIKHKDQIETSRLAFIGNGHVNNISANFVCFSEKYLIKNVEPDFLIKMNIYFMKSKEDQFKKVLSEESCYKENIDDNFPGKYGFKLCGSIKIDISQLHRIQWKLLGLNAASPLKCSLSLILKYFPSK